MEYNTAHKENIHQNQPHLIDYLNIIKKRIWIVVIFFIAVVSTVAYLSFTATPIYKATTQIIIENKSSFMEEMADVMQIDTRDEEYYQTQHKLLESRSLAKQVIRDNNLQEVFYSNNPEKQKSEGTQPKSSDSSESGVTSKMVDWYLANLEVSPIRQTHLVNISFLNKSPETSARITNAHAQAFIEKNIRVQRTSSQQALDWLKSQIQGQKAKVGSSQRAAYQYKYEELSSFTIDDENIYEFPEIKNNPTIQDFREQLAEVKGWILQNSTKYGPNHPKIKEAQSGIKRLEQGIIDEVQKVKKHIKTELDRLVALEKSIQQSKSILQNNLLARNEKAINYEMANLEAKSDQEIYDILIKQASEIGLTGDMKNNTIRVVDKAETPLFPSKPRKLLNMALAVVVGLTFGIGLTFFIEYMDNTIKTPEDLACLPAMPALLSTVPYIKTLKKSGIQALSENTNYRKQKKRRDYYYDNTGCFVNRLPLTHGGAHGKAYMIGSSTTGEGKTTILAKSAMGMARGGLSVIMIDADMHNPNLHNLFGSNTDENKGITNAMDKIRGCQISEGSLKDCSVEDLFFLISLKKLSGKLTITSELQTIVTVFENGRLFHVDSKEAPFANLLGTMLLRGGFITESQLEDALERKNRTGAPLGYILINSGYINQDKLQGPLKLQTEEHLQKLFSWKDGTYLFEPGSIETYEDKRVFFGEDFTPLINRLSRPGGSRLLEHEVFSNVTTVNGSNLSLIHMGNGQSMPEGPAYFKLIGKFLNLLKQRYDVVLVDSPPLLDASESAMPLLPLVDGMILVVKSGQVTVDAVNRATSCINESGTKLIGTILNQADGQNYYKS